MQPKFELNYKRCTITVLRFVYSFELAYSHLRSGFVDSQNFFLTIVSGDCVRVNLTTNTPREPRSPLQVEAGQTDHDENSSPQFPLVPRPGDLMTNISTPPPLPQTMWLSFAAKHSPTIASQTR